MDDYSFAMFKCCFEAEVLHFDLKKQLEKRSDMSGFVIDDIRQDSFCFRVSFPKPIGEGKNITNISVSVPSDAMGNRYMDNNQYPKTIETVLFSGNELVYEEELGYSDIVSFYGDERASESQNIAKLIDHINQLALGQRPDDV